VIKNVFVIFMLL